MLVTRKCYITGVSKTLDLDCTPEQMDDWQRGVLIQDAIPNLNADDREFIMTGITSDVWEEAYHE